MRQVAARKPHGDAELAIDGTVGGKRYREAAETVGFGGEEGSDRLRHRAEFQRETRRRRGSAARGDQLRPAVIEKIDERLGGDELLDDGVEDGGARIGRDLAVDIADLGAAFGSVQVIAENLPGDRHPQGREIHPLLDARHIPVLDGLREIVRAPRTATP